MLSILQLSPPSFLRSGDINLKIRDFPEMKNWLSITQNVPKDTFFLDIFTNFRLVFSHQRNKCLLPSNEDSTSVCSVETTPNLT